MKYFNYFSDFNITITREETRAFDGTVQNASQEVLKARCDYQRTNKELSVDANLRRVVNAKVFLTEDVSNVEVGDDVKIYNERFTNTHKVVRVNELEQSIELS